MKPSTTKLGKILHEMGVVDEPFTARDLKKGEGPKGVGNETYGKKSFLYISCDSHDHRREVEHKLRHEYGITSVCRGYGHPRSSTMEVGVTYFKGFHHDV